jgi:hypothetical protein
MKIKNIIINKYKAFTKEETIPINGKNTFIYGENGSGKSSFYYAMKDFFQSSVEYIDMANLRNIYLNDGGLDCSVEIVFDNNEKFVLSQRTKTTTSTDIKDANRLKSFLTYKHLMAVHNLKMGNQLDLFDLVVNGVLKHFKSATITDDMELGILWNDIITESNKESGRDKEFPNTRKKKESVDEKLNVFNNAMSKLFHETEENLDYIGPNVNRILAKLDSDLKIEFKPIFSKSDDRGIIDKGKLNLKVEYKGKSLENNYPQFILNEAKLSSIAISIFLGVISKQSAFSKEIKLLFLDDILIGLDNENRIILLDLLLENGLQKENKLFGDFQIFITTYDRYWYEVSKLKLNGWNFLEFYKGKEGPIIFHNDQTDMQKAKYYLEAYDFPACANYQRKICERILKEKLLETYSVGERRLGLVQPLNLDTLFSRLILYYVDLGIDPPLHLVETLRLYKSILFNPMSHDDLKGPIYKIDLENAFKVINVLKDLNLPVRTLLIKKGTMFNLVLDAIDYHASIEIAKNLYIIAHNGKKGFSPILIFCKEWTRMGVKFAKPTGCPPEAISERERLSRILNDSWPIDKVLKSLNQTFRDRKIAEISINDLLKNITTIETTLSDLLK